MPSLTPLALLALALLVERPMHAYEMFQVMTKRRHERIVKLRPGSLYHTVDRLVRDELAVAIGVDREGNRPERTTYEITDAGRNAVAQHLADMLAAPAEEYPQFPLAMSEAHNLPAARVIELLTRRLEAMRLRLAFYDAGYDKLRLRELARPFWIDLDYQRTMLQAEIAWVEGVVSELESGALDWDATTPDAATRHAFALAAALESDSHSRLPSGSHSTTTSHL